MGTPLLVLSEEGRLIGMGFGDDDVIAVQLDEKLITKERAARPEALAHDLRST